MAVNTGLHVHSLCHVRLFVTPWTVAHQAPLSMGFSRIKTASPESPALVGRFFTPQATWEASHVPSEHLYHLQLNRAKYVKTFLTSYSAESPVKKVKVTGHASLQPHGLHSPWNSPGQNAGMGSLSLLQGIFPTQGLNPGLPHCRQILHQLSYQASPRILEWVAYPFHSRSSWPWNGTGVSSIASGFFTNGAIREAWKLCKASSIDRGKSESSEGSQGSLWADPALTLAHLSV